MSTSNTCRTVEDRLRALHRAFLDLGHREEAARRVMTEIEAVEGLKPVEIELSALRLEPRANATAIDKLRRELREHGVEPL